MIRKIIYYDNRGNELVRYYDTVAKRFIKQEDVTKVDEVVRKNPDQIYLKEGISLRDTTAKRREKPSIDEQFIFTISKLCEDTCWLEEPEEPICKKSYLGCPISLLYDNYKFHKERNFTRLVKADLKRLYRIRDTILELRKWNNITTHRCPRCNGYLSFVKYYPHPGGWIVLGLSEKQWLYKECISCKYQWSYTKLGVNKDKTI